MFRHLVATLSVAAILGAGATPGVIAQQANPRAPKNPCAVKNPCAPKNPCAAKVDPKLITRPKGTKLAGGDHAALLEEGERLWRDTRLSTNGLACQTCHQGNAAFQPTFAKPYPHAVAMVSEKAGLKRIQLDEMVQICMLVPMASKPLPWASKELAALTAYAAEVQKHFKPKVAGAANPYAPKNPCAPKK